MDELASLDEEETTNILSECGLTFNLTVSHYIYFLNSAISGLHNNHTTGLSSFPKSVVIIHIAIGNYSIPGFVNCVLTLIPGERRRAVPPCMDTGKIIFGDKNRQT